MAKKLKIVSKAWHIEPQNEGDPSMVIYYPEEKSWRIMGQTLHDLTGNIKPSDKGAIYAYKYYMANK